MVRDEKAELLATVNSLRGCSRSQLRDIARLSDLLSAPAGRVLVTEGAAARGGHQVGDLGELLGRARAVAARRR